MTRRRPLDEALTDAKARVDDKVDAARLAGASSVADLYLPSKIPDVDMLGLKIAVGDATADDLIPALQLVAKRLNTDLDLLKRDVFNGRTRLAKALREILGINYDVVPLVDFVRSRGFTLREAIETATAILNRAGKGVKVGSVDRIYRRDKRNSPEHDKLEASFVRARPGRPRRVPGRKLVSDKKGKES